MKVAKNQLTARQRQFCQHYAGSARHNSALAARMAGYAAASSHVTGCKLVKMEKVAATVRDLEDAVAVEMGYTRIRLIAELLEAVNMGRTMSLPSVMVSGLVAISKAAGLDKPEKTPAPVGAAQDGLQHAYYAMSDNQLLALLTDRTPVVTQP